MQSFGVDDLGRDGSPNGSSDNDPDDAGDDVEDVDANAEADQDPDQGENENEDDEDDEQDNNEDEEDPEQDNEQEAAQDPFSDTPTQSQSQSQLPSHPATSAQSPTLSQAPNGLSAGPTSHPTVTFTSPSPRPSSRDPPSAILSRPTVRLEALTAPVYDIVPTIAAPHSTSINAVTATPDLRWVFSGGADGYIRKFNWVDTANAKAMLTVAQRHPFVDSVVKAGVLSSYWENEDSQYVKTSQLQTLEDNTTLSPVYSLAVQHQALWLLSGLESGGIRLQSIRHDEGKRIADLRQHTSAVSVLSLIDNEKSLLSGSWDKKIHDWDLNTGQVRRSFEAIGGGQISAIEIRPNSSLSFPADSGNAPETNGTYSSNNTARQVNGDLEDTFIKQEVTQTAGAGQEGEEDAPGSPADSLFGGNDADSLFGDNDDNGNAGLSGGNFGDDEDDEFSRAIASGIQQQEDEDAEGDTRMTDNPEAISQQQHNAQGESGADDPMEISGVERGNGSRPEPPPLLTNGHAHAEDLEQVAENDVAMGSSESTSASAGTDDVFLSASIDGPLRVWDRRQPNPVSTILPKNTPPWCMNACWSPDGNFIYAGRRNGTVEEFSVQRGLHGAERTFKFPQGSGPVSALKAMPNGRHLICASYDILRLYDLKEAQPFKHSTVPFLIVPGHRTGVISHLYLDPTCRYLISTGGNRGWEGATTEVLLGYEVGIG